MDQLIGDPRRGHPVAIFGSAAARFERAMWRDRRAAGAAYTGVLVGATTGFGVIMGRCRGVPLFVLTAAGTWAVLGGRSLVDEAEAISTQLTEDDLPAARRQLTHLVGRRTEELDEAEIARAAVESVAENTSDAVVAPLFWGAVAGLPGLLGYRAINTLDAMVGHHNARYENFGWASARLDDVANFVPARLTALLTAALAPLVGGSARRALEVARRDGRRHPSPNSGVAEAAFAGALDVRLGGRNDYGARIEQRPLLGAQGSAPTRVDLARAGRLSQAVTIGAVVFCAAVALLGRRRP